MLTVHLLQVGCGADELIDLLMRCILDPGDSIVDCPPTFTMYAFDAAVNDAQVLTVPRREHFQLDMAGEPMQRPACFRWPTWPLHICQATHCICASRTNALLCSAF